MNIMSFNAYFIDKMTVAKNDETVSVDATVQTRGEKLNALLFGESIDIAGFQEISIPWLNWLQNGLDGRYGVTGIVSTPSVSQGVYIIYRKDKFDLLDNGGFWLAEGVPQSAVVGWDGRFERGCTWALLRCRKSGTYLLALNTHMDHIGEVARSKGAKTIVEYIDTLRRKVKSDYGIENCPVVLTGDMNSRPDSEAYAAVTSTLQDSRVCSKGITVDALLATSPEMQFYRSEADYLKNGHIIDYVFVSEDVTVQNYKMIHTASNLCPYGSYISDHNAVISQIMI